MIVTLEVLLALLIIGSIAFYLTCAVCSQQFFSAPEPTVPSHLAEPPISLLVPVCGVDAGAWENWLSLCKQDYQVYEVLFGVTDPKDPAIPVLEQLQQQFPDRVRLFTDLQPRGINYKDSNLSYLLEAAQYDYIVFADSDICVSPDYLSLVTVPLADPQVGMVTCCFAGHQPQHFGSALASAGRCWDFIPSLLIARILDRGLRCAIGATIATRRDALDRYGGLHLNRIGSDYNIGKRAAQAGYRVELSQYVLESDTGEESVTQLFKRELRWARTIRYNRGAIYYTMAFCYGTVYCLPLLLLSGWADWAVALTLLTYGIRLLQVWSATHDMNCLGLLKWIWILPYRDAMSWLIWAIGGFGQEVHWRGRRLRVQADGLLSPAD